jgi:hypothetical protein
MSFRLAVTGLWGSQTEVPPLVVGLSKPCSQSGKAGHASGLIGQLGKAAASLASAIACAICDPFHRASSQP